MAKNFEFSDIYDYKHFPCLTDFVCYCDDLTKADRKRIGKANRIHSETGGFSFTLTEDYAEASKLVREGWPDGVRKIEDTMTQARQGLDIVVDRKPEYDVCGPISVTGAYCSGDPECMLNPAEQVEKPAVNIIVDIMAAGSQDAEAIRNRGAAILAIAELLESHGMRCSIYAVACADLYQVKHATDKKHNIHLTIVKCKDAGEEFNLHGLSYALVHPSMLRRHWFRVVEKDQNIKDPATYGHCVDLQQIEGVENALGDIDLHFPSIFQVGDEHFYSVEAAIKYAKQRAIDAGLLAE